MYSICVLQEYVHVCEYVNAYAPVCMHMGATDSDVRGFPWNHSTFFIYVCLYHTCAEGQERVSSLLELSHSSCEQLCMCWSPKPGDVRRKREGSYFEASLLYVGSSSTAKLHKETLSPKIEKVTMPIFLCFKVLFLITRRWGWDVYTYMWHPWRSEN